MPDQRQGGIPELVTFVEIGRRVGLSRQRVRRIADTDPDWPVPKEQWVKVGPSWAVPWEPVAEYFRSRKPQHGVHHETRLRRKGEGEMGGSDE